jgi:hypothetical protein
MMASMDSIILAENQAVALGRIFGEGQVPIDLMASEEELKLEIERLRTENEALKKPARGQTYLKVSEKGALSVYGMGRFPVMLDREQWEKLLSMPDEIRNFIRENDHSLKKIPLRAAQIPRGSPTLTTGGTVIQNLRWTHLTTSRSWLSATFEKDRGAGQPFGGPPFQKGTFSAGALTSSHCRP